MRRDTGAKAPLPLENLEESLLTLLDTIHEDMYNRALVERDANLAVTGNWEEFCSFLDQKKLIMSPFCGGEWANPISWCVNRHRKIALPQQSSSNLVEN